MVVEGGTTIEVFLTFLEHCLCPALRPGQTVLLDNLRVHKNRVVTARIDRPSILGRCLWVGVRLKRVLDQSL